MTGWHVAGAVFDAGERREERLAVGAERGVAEPAVRVHNQRGPLLGGLLLRLPHGCLPPLARCSCPVVEAAVLYSMAPSRPQLSERVLAPVPRSIHLWREPRHRPVSAVCVEPLEAHGLHARCVDRRLELRVHAVEPQLPLFTVRPLRVRLECGQLWAEGRNVALHRRRQSVLPQLGVAANVPLRAWARLRRRWRRPSGAQRQLQCERDVVVAVVVVLVPLCDVRHQLGRVAEDEVDDCLGALRPSAVLRR